MVRKQSSRFKKSLSKIVDNNFDDVLRRIKEVKFLPDRILIVLVPSSNWASRHAIRISVLLLNARVFFYKNQIAVATNIISLTDLNVNNFIYYDEERHILSIPIANSFALHLIDHQKNHPKVKKFTKK